MCMYVVYVCSFLVCVCIHACVMCVYVKALIMVVHVATQSTCISYYALPSSVYILNINTMVSGAKENMNYSIHIAMQI